MAAVEQNATALPNPDAPTAAEQRAAARAVDADQHLEPALEQQRRDAAEARRETPSDEAETPSGQPKPSRHERMQRLFASLDKESEDAEANRLQREAAAELAEDAEDVIAPQREAQAILDKYENDVRRYRGEAEEKQAIIDDALRLAKESPLDLLEALEIDPAVVARHIQILSDPSQRAAIRERQAQQAVQQLQQSNARAAIESEFCDALYDLNPAWRQDTGLDRRAAIKLGDEIANEATRQGMTFTAADIADAVLEYMKLDDTEKTVSRVKLAEGTQAKAKAAAKKPKAAPSPTNPQDWRKAREQRLSRMYRGLGGGRYGE